MQSTRAALSTSHAGEVCFCGRRVAREQAGLDRDVQKGSGSEWNFVLRVRADVDGRHNIQREIARHDRACRATTPKYTTARTASIMQVRATLRHAMPRCDCTSLHARSTWRQIDP